MFGNRRGILEGWGFFTVTDLRISWVPVHVGGGFVMVFKSLALRIPRMLWGVVLENPQNLGWGFFRNTIEEYPRTWLPNPSLETLGIGFLRCNVIPHATNLNNFTSPEVIGCMQMNCFSFFPFFFSWKKAEKWLLDVHYFRLLLFLFSFQLLFSILSIRLSLKSMSAYAHFQMIYLSLKSMTPHWCVVGPLTWRVSSFLTKKEKKRREESQACFDLLLRVCL